LTLQQLGRATACVAPAAELRVRRLNNRTRQSQLRDGIPMLSTMARSVALLLVLAGALVVTGCKDRKPGDEAAISTKSAAVAPAAILVTDCGCEMDDQWALAHLLLSTELDLRAVITTHASSIRFSSATSAEKAAEVIQHVLPVRASSLPVVAGSPEPLQDAKVPRENAGVDLLLRVSRDFSESRRLTVFSIGASTDVASAILKDPSVSNRITVVAMGFIDWPSGGDFFNVKNDPLAWQVILNSDVPLVIGSGTTATRGLKLTRAEAAALMRSHGPTGEYLYSLFDDWLTREPKLVAQVVAPETWVLWDHIVVAYALGMARGREVPRPQLQPDLSFSHPETTKRITWLDEIDTERLWRDFTRKIDSRARNSP
jgi:inosine-uridine nucleoside N-ribohydrolase